MRILVLFAMSAILVSCNSMQKKCENTNWYGYGYQLALKGTRPANDNGVAACRREQQSVKEDELDRGFKEGMGKYCSPESALKTGRNGDPLNMDLCSESQAKELKEKHAEGVASYCTKENGFTVGSAGLKPKSKAICPTELRKTFYSGFRLGLIEFIKGKLAAIPGQIAELNRLEAGLERDRISASNQLAAIPPPPQFPNRAPASTTILNNQTGALYTVTNDSPVNSGLPFDPNTGARMSLQNQLGNIENDIQKVRTARLNLVNNQGKLKTQLNALMAADPENPSQ